MALAFFQASQAMMPINTQTRHPKVQNLGPIPLAVRPVPRKLRRVVGPFPLAVRSGSRKLRRVLVLKSVKCSASCSSSMSGEDSVASLKRCLLASEGPIGTFEPASSSASSMSAPIMKKGKDYSSLGAVTLEKGKVVLSKKPKFSPELETGGGGGDIGKIIRHGGGDGGDDDGDDDDYYDDFDDGDEGDEGDLFRRRKFLEEIFDRKFVDAVLYEWQKTMMDLPAGFRQAYEMGLVSSAQMLRYLAINARPTFARAFSRILPQAVSRAFIGRMIADPAFLHKLIIEMAATFGCTLWCEWEIRKERIKQEWDLALLNAVTVSLCNGSAVWLIAPCRSYGNTFRSDLQNTLQKLPNNIFEKSYPLREFDVQKRIQSFIVNTAYLCMLGIGAGAVQGGLTALLASKKKERLSVTTPTFTSNALGYGSFLGFYGNLRYQLLCGLDRALMNRFDVIGVGLTFSTALRIANANLGARSRLAWLGVEAADPLYQSGDRMKTAYAQNSNESPSKWFISKNAVVSGLGRLGLGQGSADKAADGEVPAPKPRRKRVVRRKVAAGSS